MAVSGSAHARDGGAAGSDFGAWRSGMTIATAIAVAVLVSLLRARAGTADLWFDDAWVALATRVPLSKVGGMGVSAPGFTVVARWWLGLAPGSVAWAQSFALLGLVVSPVIVFVAARIAGAARWAAATVACLTALSPILLAESARVKQYTWEYAFSAAIVAVAAMLRRDGPTARVTWTAAALVAVASIFSGSLMIPGSILFLLLAVGLGAAVRRAVDPLPLRVVCTRVMILTLSGAIVSLWAEVYVLHPPAALADWWRVRDGFLGSSGSVTHTVRQAFSMLRTITGALIFGGGTALMIVPVGVLAWFIWHKWRRVWWLLVSVVVAVVLSATQRYPLGAHGVSRIEAWLLPWVVVLLALALTDLGATRWVRRLVAGVSSPIKTASVALVTLALVGAAWQETHHYPTVRARAALSTITAGSVGSAYVADEDFPVDLLVPTRIRVVDDNVSTTGWTVRLAAGGPHVLHVEESAVAAAELRPACGGTAGIAGVTRAEIAKVLPLVGCRVLRERVTEPSAAGTWDGSVVLSLAPHGQ